MRSRTSIYRSAQTKIAKAMQEYFNWVCDLEDFPSQSTNQKDRRLIGWETGWRNAIAFVKRMHWKINPQTGRLEPR